MDSPCRTERSTFSQTIFLRVAFSGCLILLGFACNSISAATLIVPAGGDLQAAINSAKFGDTIILQSGGVYQTPAAFQPFVLTDKGAGTGFITITSSTPPPPDGTRVTLANRQSMPKCVVRAGSSFFEARAGAHHYKISGLWFTNTLGVQATQLLSNNSYDITHQDPADPAFNWPHDIVIDHNWFNPAEWDAEPDANLYSSVNAAVGMVGQNVTVRDNVMKGFGAKYASDHSTILDSEAVLVGTAPGPMLIDNNFMEAWFVGFFIGGGDPGSYYGGTVVASPAPTLTSATLSNVTNLHVGDNIAFEMTAPSPYTGETTAAGTITAIIGNAVTFTPLSNPWVNDNYSPIPTGAAVPKSPGQAYWGGYVPSNINIIHNYINKPTRWYNLNGSDGKGMFEIKLCDTCLIDGNTFDGNTGWTVTVRNQGGRAPWSVIKNLTISNNVSVRFGAGFGGLFKDNQRISKESTNIVVTNNLMYGDTGPDPVFSLRPYFFSSTYGNGVSITHNTVMQSGEIMHAGNGAGFLDQIQNFAFRDNIVNWGIGRQGYLCFDGGPASCTPNYAWTKNVMIGAPTGPIYAAQSLADFPVGNWNPASLSNVGFTDPASANYRLLSTSPYYKAASDGKDVGVDMDQLLAHLNGPIPLPVPTPSLSPTPTPTPTATPTPTSTPIPTPTPVPTPTPTPTPTPITVSITSPSTNATYSYGSSVAVQANATDPVGTVTKVTFTANSKLVGTDTVSPFAISWSNMAAGSYTVTATALDDRGVSATSPGITVKISKAVKGVRSGKNSTQALNVALTQTQPNLALDAGAINPINQLVADIDQTYSDFMDERAMFSSARLIDKYLVAASLLARAGAGMSAEQAPSSGVVDRLKKINSYLSFCEDLMVDGVLSQSTINAAKKVNASTNLSIHQPETSPVGSLGVNVMPNGTATISSVVSNPFSTQTTTATGGGSFELADVSVVVGGDAARVLSVSPTQLTIVVPASALGGVAEIVVSSREGFVLHGSASVSGLRPTILAVAGDNTNQGATVDSVSMHFGAFSTIAPFLMGLDPRTRVSILATGISSGIANTDVSNDFWLRNGQVLENLSESVTVEARTTDGRVFTLPVEYAGAQGELRGIDQVNIILIPELARAGNVQLTIVAGGRRSNTLNMTVN